LPRSVNIALRAPKVQIKYSKKASATLIAVENFRGIARENFVK